MTLRAVLAGLSLLLLAGCKASNSGRTPTASPMPPATAVIATPNSGSGVAAPPSPRPSATTVAQIGEPGLVRLDGNRALPETIAVRAGADVTWENDGPDADRIVSNEPALFETGLIAPGARATLTVTAPGYHDWHSALHPAERGTLRVLP